MRYCKAYKALVAESRRLGLPRAHKRDLYKWDREGIHRPTFPQYFGWVVYDCGTHIIHPDATDRTERTMPEIYREVFKTMFRTDRHCYVWDGFALLPMASADEMCDWLEDRSLALACATWDLQHGEECTA